MFNILDYFIILILILSIIRGFKLGILKSVGSMFIMLAALFIAILYAADFSLYLEKQFSLSSKIYQWLMLHFPAAALTSEPNLLGFNPVNYLSDSVSDLATLINKVIGFIIIVIIINLLGNMLLGFFHKRTLTGSLKSTDSLMGSVFQMTKQLLIIIIVCGLICEPLRSGHQIGINIGSGILDLVDHSYCGTYMLSAFAELKMWFNYRI